MSSEWQLTTLGATTTWMSGGTPTKDDPKFWGGDIPWISANSMHSTRYSESELRLTAEGLANGSRIALTDTVLLLVRGGALHNRIPVGIAEKDVAFNQDVKAIVAKPELLRPWYLLYWLLGHESFLLGSVVEFTGIGAGKLDTKRMQSLEMRLPSLTTQDQILEVVKPIDDRITLLRETNATLEAIAQALFKSWFVDFGPVRAKLEGRAPEGMDEATAALFPDGFEESELGMVPRGWRVSSMSQVCKISSGNRPGLRSDSATENAPIPLFGGAGIMGFTNEALFSVRKILTGRVGTLGKVHIAYPPFWASDNVLVLAPEDSRSFHFCFHWLNSIDVHALNRGSTQPLLTQKDLGKQEHIFPTDFVLDAFGAIAEVIYGKIRSNELQAQTLATLRDTLLPRLISGALRLPETS